MNRDKIDPQDVFYFYNASFDPVRLVEKFCLKDVEATPGLLTNAFGVRVSASILLSGLQDKSGIVEAPPIPANWHADVAEFGAALRAVELAEGAFNMIELGCGWGCWMNITGVVAKRRGLSIQLCGIEADKGHVNMAHETLALNGIQPKEYLLHLGVAASSDGSALFPMQDGNVDSWGLRPLFGCSPEQTEGLLAAGRYVEMSQFSLAKIAGDLERVDLLHVDIQGGEDRLIPESLGFLNEKVAYLVLGTHSREIEGRLFDSLLRAGWILEIERPALLTLGREPRTRVDGVQGWRNPALLPRSAVAEPQGSVTMVVAPERWRMGREHIVTVEIQNSSSTDWCSIDPNPVHVSYRWSRAGGAMLVSEGIRTKLDGLELRAGQKNQQRITVAVPSELGRCQLQITLVQEGIRWFELPSFAAAGVNIDVVD